MGIFKHKLTAHITEVIRREKQDIAKNKDFFELRGAVLRDRIDVMNNIQRLEAELKTGKASANNNMIQSLVEENHSLKIKNRMLMSPSPVLMNLGFAFFDHD